MIDPKRLSASKLPLLARCAYSFRADVTVPAEDESDAAAHGTAMHALCEAIAKDADVHVYPDGCDLSFGAGYREAFLLATAGADEVLVERAYAYDPATDTARLLPEGEHRAYVGVLPHELPGTVDLAWIRGGVAYVRDLKFGLENRVDGPDENMQLRALGLAVARAHGCETADVGAWFPRDDGTVPESETARLDVIELAVVAGEIVALRDGIAGSAPKLGEHCHTKYCPLRGRCVAQVNAAAVVLAPAFNITPTSDAEAARLVEMLPVLEDLAKALRAELAAYAKAHGVFGLPDGRRFGPVDKRRESIAATPEVLAVLAAEGVAGAAVTETTTTVTKDALEKACMAVTPRGKGAGKIRDVLAKVGAVGGLTVSEWVAYEVWATKKSKKAKEMSDG